MVLRRMSLMWIAFASACGASGSGAKEPQGEPAPIKKAALSWGIKPLGSSSDVFLTVTDENGRATSHPLGRHDGECAILSSGRGATGAITATLCKRGDVGVELDVIPRPGVLIVLKLPYVAGAEPDPLAGEEVAHINVPIGAKIEVP